MKVAITTNDHHFSTKTAHTHISLFSFFFFFLFFSPPQSSLFVAQIQPLLAVAQSYKSKPRPGSAYVQILPLITPKNVLMQNICRDFNK